MRHGQSLANAEGWLAGHRDVPLTELGRAQAREIGKQVDLAAIRRVYSSDLARAVDTARLIGAEPVPVAGLRERSMGDWEGAYVADLQGRGVWDRLLEWTEGPPGGESQREVAVRVLTTLASLDPGDGDVLVVGHGTMLRATLGILDAVPVDQIGRWRIGNADLLRREVAPGRWADLLATLLRG